jgi:hypothetical protein
LQLLKGCHPPPRWDLQQRQNPLFGCTINAAAQLAIQLFLGRDPGGSHEALQHGDAGQQDPLRPEHLLGTGQQLMKSGASADLLTDKLVNEGVILAPN